MNRDFKGIWIPREIWLAKDLHCQEKCLWAEIHSLFSEEKGGCYASNEYLGEFVGVKERRLQEMLANLKRLGWLEQVSFNGRQRILRAIVPYETEKVRAGQRCTKMHPGGALKCTPDMQYNAPLSYIERKEEIKDKNIAQTIARSATQPRKKSSDITFSFDNKKFENITASDMETWKKIYVNVDIERELMKMVEWCLSNPRKTKSKRAWRKFIVSWLQKNFDEITNKAAYRESQKQSVVEKHTFADTDRRPNHPSRTTYLEEDDEVE